MLKYMYDPSGNAVTRRFGSDLAPRITGQPVTQVVAPGEIVTFSVVVVDAHAVTFQWKFNGTDIPGSTGDSLLLSDVKAADEGAYSVVVTNRAGSLTSRPAVLLLDSDGDGLPDSWENAVFKDPDPTHPLNPANQRSETDPDKDGVSNLDEFFDNTNPTNKRSLRPRLIVFSGVGGSVAVTPMKLSYEFQETVTLTALPFPPSGIVHWAGDLDGADNPVTLVMDRNKTVRARFAFPVLPPPGLIALWRGETDPSDLVGGHHGAFFAGTTLLVPRVTESGKVGGAFEFDGTVHVRVPDSTTLRPAQLTVEAWVFPSGLGGGFQAIVARGSSKNEDDTWYLGLHNRTPQFWSHGNQLLEGPFVIPLDEWTHLAITFDGSTKRLYVDGAQVAFGAGAGALNYDAAPVPVTLGSDWANNVSSSHFKGRIDEVALYNRALTADDILSIYNANFAGKNFSQPYFTSPAQLPDGVLGASYTQQLVAILGTGPISFSLAAGVLPPGITFSPTGVASGVFGARGVFDFVVLATDAAGAATEQGCVLRVV